MIFSIIKSLFKAKEPESPLEERADEELMLLYAEGEVKAFEILLKRYERPLFNFIVRSVRREDLAEELLQEVFIRVIKSASNYQQTAKFSTWIYTIARNICIDRARKKSGKELSLDQPIGDSNDGRSHVDLVADTASQVSTEHDRTVFLGKLEEALARLPEDQREVFLMREVSDLKFREISEILGVPVPTVKSRMRYALEALRGHMAEYAEHSFDEEDVRVNSSSQG